MPAGAKYRLRRDTAANWTSANPVLAAGEFGYETDTNKLKIGNGTSVWTALTYFGGGPPASGSVSYYNHITLITNHSPNAWTNMPAAATEFGSHTRTRQKVILTNAVDARLTLSVSTAGTAASILYVQYSPDGTTWTDLGISAPVNTVGDKVSAFVAVPTAAKGDVFLRIMGSGGDGVIDPIFGTIGIGVRYSAPVA